MAYGSPTPTPSGCSARLRGREDLREVDAREAGLFAARRGAATPDLDVRAPPPDLDVRAPAAFVARFAERPAARPRAFCVRVGMIASR
jgi:hypothetical protein